jgi:C4-type Zn-finger protein
MNPAERKTAEELAAAAIADPGEAAGGIACPRCECRDLRVVKTRRSAGVVVRKRQCRHCGWRVTTVEK